MWSFLLTVLLIATASAFFYVWRQQQERIDELRRKLHEVEVQEHRVFDFLHGLGEAFTDEIQAHDLGQLIVEGAVRIHEAHGGALYLADRTGLKLALGYMSKSCPALVSLPAHVLEQAASTPVAIESYLRLHQIEPGEGLLGSVWRDQEPKLVTSPLDDERLDQLKEIATQTESAIVVPLTYAKQKLGVLAIANGPMGTPFTPSDFEVFKAISEQSAFALYNAMVYLEAGEKKRLDLDLQTARDIQRILLPTNSPNVPGYDVSGITLPARYVSGDYYDFIKVDDDRIGIVIADVSGKGVPASLIMAMCRSVLRSHAPGNISASDVLRKVNRQLYPDIREDMFISMAYVILNHTTKQMTLSRAGHDAPFFYSAADETVTRLNPPGMAIGIDSGGVFDRVTSDFSVNLDTGDCLILFTDGIIEAIDRQGLEYGVPRAIQNIQAAAPEGAAEIVRRLTEDLRIFVGKQPQYDDVTLIAIKRT